LTQAYEKKREERETKPTNASGRISV